MPFEQKLKISNLISKTIGNVIRTNDSHTLMYHSVSKSLGENDDIYSINENLFNITFWAATADREHLFVVIH